MARWAQREGALEPLSSPVVVFGSLNVDLVVRAPRVPEAGETLVAEGFATFAGGKGLNQAVAARRAGVPVAMVGRVGDDDLGRTLRAHLGADGVDATQVRSDAAGTGVALIVVEPRGANRILVVPRANGRVGTDDAASAAEAIRAAAVLVLQGEVPLEASLHAARLAAGAGVPVVFNPAPAPVASGALDELLRLSAFVLPNEAELAALAGGRDDRALRQLRARTGGPVLATLGERGAVLLEEPGQSPRAFQAHRVRAVDTVGAGDAFVGAFAAALAEGATVERAVAWGLAAGALACTVAGALPAMPRREAILRLAGADG